MNNMKRLIAVMLMLTLVLCCVACAQPQNNPSTSAPKTEPSSEPTSSATQPTTTNPTTAPTPSHTVKVVDEEGNPVAGIAVQLCDDGSCYNPQITNEEGIAAFFMPGITGAKARIYAATSAPTYPYNRTDCTIDVLDGMDAEGYLYFGDSNTITLTVTKVAA